MGNKLHAKDQIQKNWFEKYQQAEEAQREHEEANTRKVYLSREEFAKDYPLNEWAIHAGKDWIFLPVMRRYTCIKPGFYLAYIHPPSQKYMKWDVTVWDGDDFSIKKRCETEQEAKEAMQLLISFAPASFHEIVSMEVGFEWD